MMNNALMKSILVTALGVLLIAAGYADLDGYWDKPSTKSNHDWSALEKNMRPEACAQCHESQFNTWKLSRHSKAYSSGLIGQFPDMGHGQGNDCLRCHAPLDEQLYSGEPDMLKSLSILRKHPQGFDLNANLDSPEAKLPLRHSGVSCAVCHVRSGNRFGPPRKNDNTLGFIKTETHGGFTASKKFEQSGFCAECHQFPQRYAINGKPLENTVFEWQQSRFSKQGKQCQGCHMPDRQHTFKGIHDKDFTRQGLDIQVNKKHGLAQLKITSTNIGHAFPTYVTPKVLVSAVALGKRGEVLKTWRWEIVREVFYGNGWQEKQDTRLMPDESRRYVADNPPKASQSVRFDIKVVPDNFYKSVYQSLLDDDLQADAKVLIQRALDETHTNDYVLFSDVVKL
ncbi:MAG TPA: hypothetical protein EYG66_06710 [Mariprofundaceae bacterium]|nr:hypothetical protein [Mariprofundaceae bacterium]